MAYDCSFKHRNPKFPGRFEVQAYHRGISGMLRQQERRGEIEFDRVVLNIRSVHGLQGSALHMATPLGYVFEEVGVVVGSVEINGTPIIRYAPETYQTLTARS